MGHGKPVRLMKKILTLLSVLGVMAFTTVTADAHCESPRRLVGYTHCGIPIYSYYEIVGRTRCGEPIGEWVTHYPSDCHCRDHHSHHEDSHHSHSGFHFSFRL